MTAMVLAAFCSFDWFFPASFSLLRNTCTCNLALKDSSFSFSTQLGSEVSGLEEDLEDSP